MEQHAERIQEILEKLLQGHGLATARHDEWLFANDDLPAIRGNLVEEIQHENSICIQLDIDVFIGEDLLLKESFAGLGETVDAAIIDAFGNFALNSLHVILAAFWNLNDEEQVTVENWDIGGGQWVTFIGPYGLRGSDNENLNIPEDFFSTLEQQIKSGSFEGTICWVRAYVGNTGSNKRVYEVLRNNEPWDEAQAAIGKLGWPESEKFYSVRVFLVLKKTEGINAQSSETAP